MKSISIIDYGVGNILSVARAFQHFDAQVTFIQHPEEIAAADRLILPGVGAFSDGIQGLKEKGFVDHIKQYAVSGKPFMGICLGMQMMLTQSFEFGTHAGLDLIEGEVVPIPRQGIDGAPHKIPHIGWNELKHGPQNTSWEGSVLQGLNPNDSVYFVHSFMVVANDQSHHLAEADYNGHRICAVLQQDNVYGCQFHPEKSGQVGLTVIKNFLAL